MKQVLRGFFYRTFHTSNFYLTLGIIGGISLTIGLMSVINSYNVQDTYILFSSLYCFNLNNVNVLYAFKMGFFGFSGNTIIDIIGIAILICTGFHYADEYKSGTIQAWISGGVKRKDIHLGLGIGNLAYSAMIKSSSVILFFLVSLFAPLSFSFTLEELGVFAVNILFGLLFHFGWYCFSYFCWTWVGGKAIGAFIPFFFILGIMIFSGTMSGLFSLVITHGGDFFSYVLRWTPLLQNYVLASNVYSSLNQLTYGDDFAGLWYDLMTVGVNSIFHVVPFFFIGKIAIQNKDII